MRHQIDGRKFGRNTSHRKAMFRNMANSVIEKEQVTTTVEKAKEVRRVVDRLITLGKKGTLASRRLAFDRTRDDLVVKKLFSTLSERYKEREGGYTRILKKSDRRRGDAAEMAVIELVDHPEIDRKKKKKAPVATSEGEVAGEEKATSAQAGAQKDPFNRFRKLFGSKSKVQGGKGPGGAHARTAAGRKAPAASSSNKSGGSS